MSSVSPAAMAGGSPQIRPPGSDLDGVSFSSEILSPWHCYCIISKIVHDNPSENG
jgi:hypothetical protein